MAFDQNTRNRLARFVSDARALLSEEFTRQLQNVYGIDPQNGEVTPLERLSALNDVERETARVLRETLAYYLAGKPSDKKSVVEKLDRIVREQAFTVLNRLCALRMSEARGIVLESIGAGYQSTGFQLYIRLAGGALGETGQAYQAFLYSIMDEFAVDLPALFERYSPQGRLFPRETSLLHLLKLINNPEIDLLWVEDETIGWIYQYFNSKEERKAMRDASPAPRNSRELAVRNQFFTPRYVVEFLTDNTLGRIWYEMTRGETSLKNSCQYLIRRPTEIFLDEGQAVKATQNETEELSPEELLNLPVSIPHRVLKDPREIKMIDPACGSMHFGLYAFDLFEQIYCEAWDLEEDLGEMGMWRLPDLEPLHKTYTNRNMFLIDVPRLIIERNIHGVDIDPRAVQIAGLSLWLRAQKSWHNQGVKAIARPQVRKSNIVCAEPMPGDRLMLDEFLATLKEDKLEELLSKTWQPVSGSKVRATKQMSEALAKLVRTVWQEMELAGEAGSLLKIEETLRDAIVAARKASEEKAPLFRVLEYGLNEPTKGKIGQSVSEVDQDFFDRAELLVLAALHEYTEQTESSGYRRRLFAGETVQGFSFIDLCRKTFDFAVMNPPFGQFVKSAQIYAKVNYPNSYNDIYAAFTERFFEKLADGGILGAITSRNGFFLGSFEEWRTKFIINETKMHTMVDFGENVMDDAMVEAAAYCFQKNNKLQLPNTIFIRLLGVDDRKLELMHDTENIRIGILSSRVFCRNIVDFKLLRLAPFSYWVQKKIIATLANANTLEPDVASVRCGLSTGNNDRFVRVLWEIPNDQISKRWYPLVMTGTSQPWYSPLLVAVDWKKNGKYLSAYQGSTLRSTEYYFKPGISWTRRAVRFIPYAIPAGCIPSASRYMAFPNSIDNYELLGIAGSNVIGAYLRFYGENFFRPNYLVDTVKSLPWVKLQKELLEDIITYIKEQLQIRRLAYQNYEPYNEFVIPKIIAQNLSHRSYDLVFDYNHLLTEKLDKKIANAYCLTENELVLLERDMFDAISVRNQSVIETNDEDQEGDPLGVITVRDEVINLFSYLFGIIYGRWDVRFSTGEKPLPRLVDPFASLPKCPPGMLQNIEGLPATNLDLSKEYPVSINWKGIATDGEGHAEDIENRLREVLKVIWMDRYERIENEITQTLGVLSLREYLRKPGLFFADHLSRYSKSRRVAPIYWPLSTPSNSYILWLYYHRLTDQTLFSCVNDFVDPKLKQVGEESARLRQRKGRSAAEEKKLEELVELERELKDLRQEVLRVAAFWKPNLNDGVEITAAPLWKLFQYKPWQKRLKETWGKLEAGEYDWAHLAYSIWPERVREKCKSDKSLAIAHDLEHLYVEPVGSGKKKSKKKAVEETDEMFEVE